MKTKRLITIMIAVVVTIVLLMTGKLANAQNYLTVYMDSVGEIDTIYGCDTYDSIKFVPNKGAIYDKFWGIYEFLNPWAMNGDTIFADTLLIPTTFNGQVTCQGNDGINYYGTWISINPLSLLGEDKETTYRKTIQLNVYTNYSGSGTPEFSWTPVTGLNNPAIPDPTATLTGEIQYTVTMNAPNGCIMSRNISVTLQPMKSPPICLVSVDSANRNIIYWEKPIDVPVDSFYIYKETNVTNVYKKIGGVRYHDYSVFIDTASNAKIQSNKYEISVKDSSGFESARSLPHKTMHLTLNQGQNNIWNLIWEPYEGISVSTYYIYRGTTSKNLQLIGTMSGSYTQYSDLSAPAGNVYYQLQIVSPLSCTLPDAGTQQKSTALSSVNISCSNMVSYTTSGFDETLIEFGSFSVYPNPVVDVLFIESTQKEIEKGIIEIRNIEGRIMRAVQLKSSKTPINISDLEGGFYIIKISTDKGITIKKFIKK